MNKTSTIHYFLEALQQGASQFEASAGKLKRKFWWKNCKVFIMNFRNIKERQQNSKKLT